MKPPSERYRSITIMEDLLILRLMQGAILQGIGGHNQAVASILQMDGKSGPMQPLQMCLLMFLAKGHLIRDLR